MRKTETRKIRATSRKEAIAHVRRIECFTHHLVPFKTKVVAKEYEVTSYKVDTKLKRKKK